MTKNRTPKTRAQRHAQRTTVEFATLDAALAHATSWLNRGKGSWVYVLPNNFIGTGRYVVSTRSLDRYYPKAAQVRRFINHSAGASDVDTQAKFIFNYSM